MMPSLDPAADAPFEEVYLAGGCLWGVQAVLDAVPGVVWTEAGRANGSTDHLHGPYDGYAECVRTRFDPAVVTLEALLEQLFALIDPYSVNRQGPDVGEKYRTGVYSRDAEHLRRARAWIAARPDADRVAVEVRPLTRYVRSAEEHQHRLARHPEDACALAPELAERVRG